MYIYIYIYIHIHIHIDRLDVASAPGSLSTANLRAKIMDFRGFDSCIILMLRGGIPRPIGNFPESLNQAILVVIIIVTRLGVEPVRLEASRWAVALEGPWPSDLKGTPRGARRFSSLPESWPGTSPRP